MISDKASSTVPPAAATVVEMPRNAATSCSSSGPRNSHLPIFATRSRMMSSVNPRFFEKRRANCRTFILPLTMPASREYASTWSRSTERLYAVLLKPSARMSGGRMSRASFAMSTPIRLRTVSMYSGTVSRRTQFCAARRSCVWASGSISSPAQTAPSSIHRRSFRFSSALNGSRSSGMSSASTTSHNRLSADLPGTITTSFFEVANAVDFLDKSSRPLWFAVSWHSRQWRESSGAISRSKNCSFGDWVCCASDAALD